MWKRSHGRTTKAPPDERGGNRYVRPTATAPHLDSTLPGRKLRYTKWLNLRQLLESSGRETGCGSEDFGLKMTLNRHARLWAQQSRSFRIGYVAFVPGEDSTIIMQRLQELGYRQGENLEFTYRSADGRPELLASLAAELVNTRPDVLVAGFGTLPAKAAKAATSTIPIVFASVRDPVGTGLINSLNRPGGNVTGVTSEASHFDEPDVYTALAEIARVMATGGVAKVQMAHRGGLMSTYRRTRSNYCQAGGFRVRYWSCAICRLRSNGR
jgi:ABC transporter substrate binding protein